MSTPEPGAPAPEPPVPVMDSSSLAPLTRPGRSGGADPEDPAAVLAMAVVLRVERAEPPARTALLEAAAAAALAVCLDGRCAPDGLWHAPVLAWTSSRIRKVSRRARGAHWRAVQELDGVTVDVDGAQARALVPGPVGELDPRVRRLQISGTDLEDDAPGAPTPGLPLLLVDPRLEMTVGKLAAQVGHATMLLGAELARTDPERLARWHAAGLRCAVRPATAAAWARALAEVAAGRAVAVRDAGFTEVPAGSTTVVASWP